MLPHLLFIGLPTAFSGTSPYVLLPFYTPKAVAGILKGNKVIDQYDLKVRLLRKRYREDRYLTHRSELEAMAQSP